MSRAATKSDSSATPAIARHPSTTITSRTGRLLVGGLVLWSTAAESKRMRTWKWLWFVCRHNDVVSIIFICVGAPQTAVYFSTPTPLPHFRLGGTITTG